MRPVFQSICVHPWLNLICIPQGVQQPCWHRAIQGAFIMNDDTATEEQFIDFKCPCCGEQISFPATSGGSVQECVDCTEPIIVPESGGEGRRIPLPFATTNLTLRKFRGADWKDLLQLFSDEQFFDAAPFKLDGEEQIARWLEADAVVKLTTPGVPFILAVETKDNAKVIGCLSLNFSDAARLQAILYIVHSSRFSAAGIRRRSGGGRAGILFPGNLASSRAGILRQHECCRLPLV